MLEREREREEEEEEEKKEREDLSGKSIKSRVYLYNFTFSTAIT